MGRLSTRSPARRGRLRRSLLLFAVLLLGPATGFSILGWNSVVSQHEFRVREMHTGASDVLVRRMSAAAADLDLLRRAEDARQYYEYQERYMPKGQTAGALLFQESALARKPSDPRVLTWFQWELYDGKAYGRPDMLPRAPGPAGGVQVRLRTRELKTSIALAYGAALEERLLRAPYNEDLKAGSGRTESYSHRVVAANEERGKLEEEIQVQQIAGRQQGLDNYGQGFETRAQEALIGRTEAPVRVRYTAFQYLARAPGDAGPPLLAWRLVWIPDEQRQWRETQRDRWLSQGYALDPSSVFPTEWERIGSAQIRRRDQVEDLGGQSASIQSLATALGAERAGVRSGSRGLPSEFAASLTLVARADMAVARSAWESASNRYWLLIAGLVVVVGVGFTVLVHGVRRELALVRRKEDFIAAITHELKTPLTGIRMYADMLREGWVESPESADKYAGRILDETERLGNLVDQVLDLAALERGMAVLNAQPGDLGEAVTSAIALMEQKASEAGVALELDVEAGLPAIPFDPTLVRPLVLNLVDNAIKYSLKSEEKNVRVTVRRGGERLVLSVTDRGVGIPPKARKAVFEPFQRGGDELTRDAPGVGIGLALVKRYAEAHKARIHLASEPGKGTRIEVRFPMS